MSEQATPTANAPSRRRAARRTVIGTVISDKMEKTISVRVSRKVRHRKYGKYVTRLETMKAHDEHGKAKTGDTVEIAFARRLSKTKSWRLVRIVSSARVVAVRGEEEIEALATSSSAPAAGGKAAAPAAAPAPAGKSTEGEKEGAS